MILTAVVADSSRVSEWARLAGFLAGMARSRQHHLVLCGSQAIGDWFDATKAEHGGEFASCEVLRTLHSLSPAAMYGIALSSVARDDRRVYGFVPNLLLQPDVCPTCADFDLLLTQYHPQNPNLVRPMVPAGGDSRVLVLPRDYYAESPVLQAADDTDVFARLVPETSRFGRSTAISGVPGDGVTLLTGPAAVEWLERTDPGALPVRHASPPPLSVPNAVLPSAAPVSGAPSSPYERKAADFVGRTDAVDMIQDAAAHVASRRVRNPAPPAQGDIVNLGSGDMVPPPEPAPGPESGFDIAGEGWEDPFAVSAPAKAPPQPYEIHSSDIATGAPFEPVPIGDLFTARTVATSLARTRRVVIRHGGEIIPFDNDGNGANPEVANA